ncbi:MAG: DUF3365 domain-containing protein [Planctomycetota bacterium]
MKPLARLFALALASSLTGLAACRDSEEANGGTPASTTSKPDQKSPAAGEPAGRPAADPQRAQKAREVAMAFGKALLGELTAAIEAQGPVAAIAVCNERAPGLAAAAATSEFRVRRIGTRVRNRATNTPTESERAILTKMESMEPDTLRSAALEESPNGVPAVYVPILVASPMCLMCHGDQATLAADVRAKLASLYPDDEATDYAVGDLRGAFVVEPAR